MEKYYCGYCGKECSHTEYTIPNVEEFIEYRSGLGNPVTYRTKKIKPKQVDICYDCQNKIISILDNIMISNIAEQMKKREEYELNKDDKVNNDMLLEFAMNELLGVSKEELEGLYFEWKNK